MYIESNEGNNMQKKSETKKERLFLSSRITSKTLHSSTFCLRKKNKIWRRNIALHKSSPPFFITHFLSPLSLVRFFFFCTISDCATPPPRPPPPSPLLSLRMCLGVLGDHVLCDCSECVEQLSLQPCLHHQQIHVYLCKTKPLH